MSKFTAAVVQAAPIAFDSKATTEKAVCDIADVYASGEAERVMGAEVSPGYFKLRPSHLFDEWEFLRGKAERLA